MYIINCRLKIICKHKVGYNDRRNERDKEYGVNDDEWQQRSTRWTSNYNNIILTQWYILGYIHIYYKINTSVLWTVDAEAIRQRCVCIILKIICVQVTFCGREVCFHHIYVLDIISSYMIYMVDTRVTGIN